MSFSTRPAPYPSNFAGRDEHADAERFARALRPPPVGLHVLHNACPPVTPLSSALDVLLFRGVLLVAYAAADELVIARASDLDALRRLRLPGGGEVTAVAFRARDAAVAVGGARGRVVVFQGWSERAREKGIVYEEDGVEVLLEGGAGEGDGIVEGEEEEEDEREGEEKEEKMENEMDKSKGEAGDHVEGDVVSLSWNTEGDVLCKVSNCVTVWRLETDCLPVKYAVSTYIPTARMPAQPLAMGAISPDGCLVATSALYSRLSYVWALTARPRSSQLPALPCAEIVHGRTGIAAMDWKKRGGGNQALMTTDRDGTIRLWVRKRTSRPGAISHAPELATGAASWMEEIARSPHAERTPRAGAAFLDWGGGGGVADDEGDAAATNATHPLLAEGMAPKPSRCYHWIVSVAGGDARAWRVRGLDDRPRAEYARLEPASGDGLLGLHGEGRHELRASDMPLHDVAVAAMRAVAPIPLTTESKYKIGLVKSYAISNGERRLRSPEPPEPPNLVASFVLAVRNGSPYLARYDISPTSTVPAICRARIGVGHSSDVVDFVTCEQSSSLMSSNGGWLASRGKSGDVLLWRTKISTGAWEPISAVAALPGPHTAVTFAPPRTPSPNLWEVGVFACDSALGSLRLFQFVNYVNKREKVSVHDIQISKQIAVCHPRGRGLDAAVNQLVAVPLGRSFADPVCAARCAVFGIRGNGRLSAWCVCRRRKEAITMEPYVVRVTGRRSSIVTCAATNQVDGVGRQIFVTGGADGNVHVYTIGESETDLRKKPVSGNDRDNDDGSSGEDGEAEEGVFRLRELSRFTPENRDGAQVEKVEVIASGTQILALLSNGNTTVWCRSSPESTEWQMELSADGDGRHSEEKAADLVNIKGNDSLTNGGAQRSSHRGASIGYDHDGNLSVVLINRAGVFQRYRKIIGMSWECVRKDEIPYEKLPAQNHVLQHIGKGVVVTTNGKGISVLGTSKPDTHPLSFTSGAAGYSPSKAIIAHLLAGGRAWQVISALDELHSFIRKVLKRKVSETSYGAGRGLIPPPPPLSLLLSVKQDPPQNLFDKMGETENEQSSESAFHMTFGQDNLFARLMAKSEKRILSSAEGESPERSGEEGDLNESGAADLSELAKRLEIVSLAGVTRSEQGVLAAIARACSSLRSIFASLDLCGAKFALLAACHLEISRDDVLSLPTVASAVHSSSTDALMDHFLPAATPTQSKVKEPIRMWDRARCLGAGWWISTESGCRVLVERIARANFNANRNADDAALWYIALGRRSTLSALYRSQQNSRMSEFLKRDFRLPENRLAAGKNAYVLVSKHRLELAVAFFILANDVQGGLNLARNRIKDDQLALVLARILDNGDNVTTTLDHISKSCEAKRDYHKKSLVLWLAGKHEEALVTASTAQYPPPSESLSDADRLMAGSQPDAVLTLSHVLALVTRPPIRGTDAAVEILDNCRMKASRALLGSGSPVAALSVSFDSYMAKSDGTSMGRSIFTETESDVYQSSLLMAAVETLKGRAVCLAGAVRSGAAEKSLQELLVEDINDLRASPLGIRMTMKAAECAAFELGKEDEVDAAVATTCAAFETYEGCAKHQSESVQGVQAAQRNCLRVAVSRALFHVQGALSLLHHPTFSSHRLSELLSKYETSVSMIQKANSFRNILFCRLVLEFKGAVISLRFAYSFLRGDWPGMLHALRSCEVVWQQKSPPSPADLPEKDVLDNTSMSSINSACSSLAPDSVSVEALRHFASNPAILGMSRSLIHARRRRKVPSMSMAGLSAGGAVTVADNSTGTPTLSVSADDPYALIRIHPALSSTLAAASAAYLAAHLASRAAEFADSVSEAGEEKNRSSRSFWQSEAGKGYDQSFRLIRASEALEQIAEDAMAQWAPLQYFGADVSSSMLSQPDESAGAFVELWSTLGCLPEYAPSLSEAATVAAAEMAAAASRAAIEAAEQKDGGRRRRRRRERRGEFVESLAKEGLKLFDTTSADSLHGAYPVRFSAAAMGPWSGRGRHASLYREEKSLFRTLCISATDPPAVIVATPKGVQEIVPSSYTTMPAGFRSHYSAKKNAASLNGSEDRRLEALATDRVNESMQEELDEDDSFLSSYDGFGEGPYVPLELDGSSSRQKHALKRSGHDEGRKAVWRHQVQATTLASHPLRRRFASGGTDGVVRLWDFADPISLASFKEDNFGRISDLCFSAYGNTMLAVYSSGNVTVWDDPDVYSSQRKGHRGSHGSRAKCIRAYDNRIASAGTFLDERHTIVVVGDPTAPPSVGHSLRIFDTREANHAFHASWSAAVNHQSEARCVALLEDRMRVVTGGLDGSLSIVDIRTKACIAELPAHTDEVTCLALEMPRGRALVSGSANGEIKLWDSRTLRQLDVIQEAHKPTRHYWSGNGLGGLVGSYGTQGLALTDRSLISCGGDGVLKIWGPGWSDFDLSVL